MKQFFVILLLCISAWATYPGAGSDIPHNITINGVAAIPNNNVNIGPLGGDYNSVQVCWDTNNNGDSLLQFDYNVNGYPSGDAMNYSYDATSVTHHCVTQNFIMPGKKTMWNVANCEPAGSCGTSYPFNKSSTNWSVGPWGSGQYNGFYATMAMPPSGDTFAFKLYVAGPPSMYQGDAINADLLAILKDGTIPANMYATNIQVDGSNCTAGLPYGSCGATGINVLFATGAAEVINNASLNYGTSVAGSGSFAGDFVANSISNYGVSTMPGFLLRILSTNTASLGNHTLSVTLQAGTTSGTAVGSPQTVTYNFAINAQPTFTYTAPTSFPYLPAIATYNQGIADLTTKYVTAQTKSTTPPGIYNNDNFSAVETAVDPYDVANYDGPRIAFNFGKWTATITTPFAPSHSYSQGDLFLDPNGFVEVVITAGTSGSSYGCNNTPGTNCTSGQMRSTNIGNTTFWNLQAQRILMQMMHWEVVMPYYSVGQEWNLFGLSTGMDYLIEGNTLSENCNGSGHCSGLQIKALQHMLYPLSGGSGLQTQGCVWEYKFVPPGTIRTLPYCADYMLASYIVNGNPVTNQNVDEQKARTDLLIQTIDELTNYNPLVSSGNPYPCCISTATFDVGLFTEYLILDWTWQNYLNTHGHPSIIPDPRIPVKILQVASWFKTTQYNLTGTDYLAPYTPWLIPENSNNSGYYGNRTLNMLMAHTYAWLFSVYGNSCALSDSTPCRTIADSMWQYGGATAFYNAKQANQTYKLWRDFLGWRTGTMLGTSSDITPDDNPNIGALPNKLEPYPAGQFPSAPVVTQCNGNAACITWNNYTHMQTAFIMYGTTTGNINNLVNCTTGNTFTGSHDIVWTQSCQTGQLQPGTYYYGVGGTDEQGNTAFSSSCITCNGQPPWSFTIVSNAPTLSVSTIPTTLSVGQGNQGRITTTTTISGGFNSSVSLGASGLPTGVNFSFNPNPIPAPGGGNSATTITVSSTTPAGTYPTTVSANGGGQNANTTFYLTVTGTCQQLILQTQNLPRGKVGTSYNATLVAQGGCPPLTWAATTIAPPGLRVNPSGSITGTPTKQGQYTINLQVCDTEPHKQCAKGSANLQIVGPNPF
jgi:hypothetical protein